VTTVRKVVSKGPAKNQASSTLRWLKFNAVGAGGIVVQLATLTILKSGLKIDYLLATAVAVELAIVHNYFWHERFTWSDRSSSSSCLRFVKFNLTTGVFSILGNVVLMHAFVGVAHFNYFLANILTIATCCIVNFLLSDRFVFQES
jgi:putative flippase GtrA